MTLILRYLLFHILLSLSIISVSAAGDDDSTLIPFPTAPNTFNTSLTHIQLQDPSRPDPYSATRHSRSIQISLFYPLKRANCTSLRKVSYMPPQTACASNQQFFNSADFGFFDDLKLQVCCEDDDRVVDTKEYWLVILSPEVGISRLLYGAMAQHIASNGYAVITVDHPYDASIIELDDGDVVSKSVGLDPFEPVSQFNSTVEKAMEVRMRDIEFLVQQLQDPKVVKRLVPEAADGSIFYTKRMGIVGHGMGGGTAVGLVANDSRFVVGVDWDGTPPVMKEDLNRTVVFFGQENYTKVNDVNWPTDWPHLKGEHWEWDLRAGGSFDYSDLPLLMNLVESRWDEWRRNGTREGKGVTDIEGVRGLGKVDRWVAYNATTQFTTAFLDVFIKNKTKMILQGLVGEYGNQMVPYGGMMKFAEAWNLNLNTTETAGS